MIRIQPLPASSVRTRFLLLACCLLAVCSAICQAAGTRGTFTALSWSKPNIALSNVSGAYVVTLYALTRPNGYALTAQEAKASLNSLPAGRRAMQFFGVGEIISANPSNFVWWDSDAAILANHMRNFFSAYHAIGGLVDVLILDYESGMGIDCLPNDLATYNSIAADPRFLTDIKPRLAGYGFDFVPGYTDLYFVPYPNCYMTIPGHEVSKDYLIWNAVAIERTAEYFNASIWEPAKTWYPNIELSNFEYFRWSAAYGIPGESGRRTYLYGTSMQVGSHSAPVLYGGVGAVSLFPPDGAPNPYMCTPFNGLRYGMNKLRGSVLSVPSVPVSPYFADRSFSLWEYDYYQEMVLHSMLNNSDYILLWAAYPPYGTTSDYDIHLVNNLLSELDDVAGYVGKSWVVEDAPPNWTNNYYLTGMSAGGQYVWRLTPDLAISGVTVQDFKIADTPPTFAIGTTKITFPAGSALYTPATEYAPNGYWITSPIGARPTISAIQQVATPVLSAPGGTYPTDRTVTITCTTPNAEIRYTTDGTVPTSTSTRYTAPLTISANTLLRVKAFRDGWSSSAMASASYTIGSTPPTNFLTAAYTDGTRRDFPGSLGYQFTPVSNTTITALGRAIAGGVMNDNHPIELWRVTSASSGVLIATVTVTPFSSLDSYGCAYEMLPAPLTLTAGQAYRLVSSEFMGGDACREFGIVSNHRNIATIDKAVYGAAGSFPSGNGGPTDYAYVPTTFYTDGGPAPSAIAMPTFSPDGRVSPTAVTVSISCATAGALIRYTTDGEDPTFDSRPYTGAINISTATILKARAFKVGMQPSAVGTAGYEFAPNFTNYMQSLYTGTRNDFYGNQGYAFVPKGDITVTALGRAVSSSMLQNHAVRIWRESDHSVVAQVTLTPSSETDALGYKYRTLATPVTLSKGTTYRITSLETLGGDDWMDCNYIWDHSLIADMTGAVYSDGDAYPAQCYSNANRTFSAPTFYYGPPKTSTPSFSPPPGTFDIGTSVTISCATAGATIRYTTDGSDPSPTAGTVYTGAVQISSTTTLKAMAYKNAQTNSDIISGSYVITPPLLQPDATICSEGEVAIGAGIFNDDGTDQTASQSVSYGQSVRYVITVTNSGNVPDSFLLHGTGSGDEWTVRYFDAAGGNITGAVTQGVWSTGTLGLGESKTLRAEVMPGLHTTLANHVMLISASSQLNDTYVDVVKAITARAPISRVSLLAGPTVGQGAGMPITLSAVVTGGTNVEYRFSVVDPANITTLNQPYSANADCLWTPARKGLHVVTVWAHEVGDPAPFNATATLNYDVAEGYLSGVSVTAVMQDDKSWLFTATPVGGVDVKYKFRLFNGSTWTDLQDYSSTNTFRWRPTRAGNFTVRSYAKEVRNLRVNEFFADRAFRVVSVPTPPARLTAVRLTAAPSSPRPINTPITLTATPTGGTNVEYRFRVYNGIAWVDLQAYGPSRTIIWTPTVKKPYTLAVYAHEVGSSITTQVTASIRYDVK